MRAATVWWSTRGGMRAKGWTTCTSTCWGESSFLPLASPWRAPSSNSKGCYRRCPVGYRTTWSVSGRAPVRWQPSIAFPSKPWSWPPWATTLPGPAPRKRC